MTIILFVNLYRIFYLPYNLYSFADGDINFAYSFEQNFSNFSKGGPMENQKGKSKTLN